MISGYLLGTMLPRISSGDLARTRESDRSTMPSDQHDVQSSIQALCSTHLLACFSILLVARSREEPRLLLHITSIDKIVAGTTVNGVRISVLQPTRNTPSEHLVQATPSAKGRALPSAVFESRLSGKVTSASGSAKSGGANKAWAPRDLFCGHS